MSKTTISVSTNTRHQLKILAAEKDMTYDQLIREILMIYNKCLKQLASQGRRD